MQQVTLFAPFAEPLHERLGCASFSVEYHAEGELLILSDADEATRFVWRDAITGKVARGQLEAGEHHLWNAVVADLKREAAPPFDGSSGTLVPLRLGETDGVYFLPALKPGSEEGALYGSPWAARFMAVRRFDGLWRVQSVDDQPHDPPFLLAAASLTLREVAAIARAHFFSGNKRLLQALEDADSEPIMEAELGELALVDPWDDSDYPALLADPHHARTVLSVRRSRFEDSMRRFLAGLSPMDKAAGQALAARALSRFNRACFDWHAAMVRPVALALPPIEETALKITRRYEAMWETLLLSEDEAIQTLLWVPVPQRLALPVLLAALGEGAMRPRDMEVPGPVLPAPSLPQAVVEALSAAAQAEGLDLTGDPAPIRAT